MLGLHVSNFPTFSLMVTRGLLQLHSSYLHLRKEEGRRGKGMEERETERVDTNFSGNSNVFPGLIGQNFLSYPHFGITQFD